MLKKKYIVAKNMGVIKDGNKVYKEGDTFPRKVVALIKSGILIETETNGDEPEKTIKPVSKGKSRK